MTTENQLRQAEAVANREPEDAEPEECRHSWRLTGTASDGSTFYKCRNCGAEDND